LILLPGPQLAAPALLTVAPGEPLAHVAHRLQQAEVVRSAAAFTLLARVLGLDRRVKSGQYELAGGLSIREVLQVLVGGEAHLIYLTIPEGLTVDETAELLERAGLGSGESFRCLAEDAEFLASLDLPGGHLEGYLFPDTYAFAAGTSQREVVTRMTRRFFEVFSPALVDAAADQGLDVDEAVTLASLIEKETADARERSIVSAVFQNRLARGMPLQSDPTAIYGVDKPSGRITRRDLARRTAYNTYQIVGLPPGPIANPGRASLEAAVHPAANVTALYFVSRNDHTHEFSETLEQHERAVERYQRRRRQPRTK
jgi:UPF0755 protein